LEVDSVEKIRNMFELKFNKFSGMWEFWNDWSKTPFTQRDFNLFVDDHTKQGEKEEINLSNGVVIDLTPSTKGKYLSERQGEKIKEAYPRVMNKFNENETVWGSFNILTYLSSHETKAHEGSHIFSNAYKTINRLTHDFYELNTPEGTVLK
jgi:hypothetical protein